MDLTRQPPRRPSNTSIAGLVNCARMTDKARGHHAGTIGEFIYGDDSGLDKILLEFLGISAADFAAAAAGHDDESLGEWVLETSGKTSSEIDAFNRYHLEREPDDDDAKGRLKARVEEFAPGRTDITTVFQSIELDDWGSFRDVDLTGRPPRSPYCKDVAGACAVARMADKARADKAGKAGEYVYDCPIDQGVLGFLGVSAEAFQAAAYENPNDAELGDWVLSESGKSDADIEAFNDDISSRGPVSDEQRAFFKETLEAAGSDRTDVTTWFDLLDIDDEASFRKQ
jgi:hypothetical protein